MTEGDLLHGEITIDLDDGRRVVSRPAEVFEAADGFFYARSKSDPPLPGAVEAFVDADQEGNWRLHVRRNDGTYGVDERWDGTYYRRAKFVGRRGRSVSRQNQIVPILPIHRASGRRTPRRTSRRPTARARAPDEGDPPLPPSTRRDGKDEGEPGSGDRACTLDGDAQAAPAGRLEPPMATGPATSRALPLYLTIVEAADLLRTTPKAIYTMAERGFLPGLVRFAATPHGGRSLR